MPHINRCCDVLCSNVMITNKTMWNDLLISRWFYSLPEITIYRTGSLVNVEINHFSWIYAFIVAGNRSRFWMQPSWRMLRHCWFKAGRVKPIRAEPEPETRTRWTSSEPKTPGEPPGLRHRLNPGLNRFDPETSGTKRDCSLRAIEPEWGLSRTRVGLLVLRIADPPCFVLLCCRSVMLT